MQERRKYKRKFVNSKVMLYHVGANAFEAKTEDISNGGIRVSTNDDYTDKIQIKDSIKVVFLNSGDVALIFNMIVIRITTDEIAMEILNCERNGKTFPVSDLRDSLR